ncbi:MAG: hypothetical protein ACYCVD_08000 [Desulfitobacteriaceae bacterium]
MGSKGVVRHYFVEAQTLRGYISLLPNMMAEWKRTYALLGGPGTGKSTMIKMLGLELFDRGFEVDFLRSAQDPDSTVGFLLPRYGLAMLDALEVFPLRWRSPGIVERFIDFAIYTDERKLEKHRTEIIDLKQKLEDLQMQIEEQLINEFGEKFRGRVGKLLRPKEQNIRTGEKALLTKENPRPWPVAVQALEKLQRSVVNACFLHGLSPTGWLNLAPHYLHDYDQIHLEGEETLEALSWLFKEARLLGQVIEIVLHPLNPDEIIGIVFPERHLAIWQGNPENLQDQGLGGEIGAGLKDVLNGWYTQWTALRDIYTKTVDFARIDGLREELLNRLLRDLDELQGRPGVN